MNMIKERVVVSDGTELFVRQWIPDEPELMIHLCHGMTEHSGVYQEFGQALMEKNIALICHDHRGHGKTVKDKSELGEFPHNGGWDRVVADAIEISHWTKAKWDKPLFLMGHSMGSFIARRVVQLDHNQYHGLVISGTATDPGVRGKLGQGVAKFHRKVYGSKRKGHLLHRLSFGEFNRSVPGAVTDFDWLSSDAEQVKQYIDDELCGFVCSNHFYEELFRGMMEVNQERNFAKTDMHLPMYLFAGDCDPVGDMGKGVQQVYQRYQQAGVRDIECMIYPQGRHEMLHETNRAEVTTAVIEWVRRIMNQQ